MKLNERSYKKELLDSDNIPFVDIQNNMKELNFINTWLGGHLITIKGFSELTNDRKKITVCEIGCGGGDNLLAIYKWCKTKNIDVSFIGIDIKKECIEFAKTRAALNSNTTWINNDYRDANFSDKPDIIFSSLFCHHFNDEELPAQFKWMKDNSTIGFFINDLERNSLAYHAIKFLTRVFSSSYLVKNDAPLSVARGFKKNELETLFNKALISPITVLWKWAFRYLVIYKHGGRGTI